MDHDPSCASGRRLHQGMTTTAESVEARRHKQSHCPIDQHVVPNYSYYASSQKRIGFQS